jgi:hypothetical protein
LKDKFVLYIEVFEIIGRRKLQLKIGGKSVTFVTFYIKLIYKYLITYYLDINAKIVDFVYFVTFIT